MAANLEPSFTPRRKWTIALNVSLLIVLVGSVVGMVNYLSRDYFRRFHLSSQTANPLSSRTVHFLSSLTNRVKVTIYYDKDDPFYTTVLALLNEYSYANPRISVRTVDYTRDAGEAQQLLAKHAWLASTAAKNLVIFECGDKIKGVEGNELARYTLEQDPTVKEISLKRKATHFLGETLFTAALLHVTSPKKMNVYFLKGHGEHAKDNEDKALGYSKFVSVLAQNDLQVDSLSLLGTNLVPGDCNLLIIAGPTTAILESELSKIDQYLKQGGRLLCLFNAVSRGLDTGLERILARWGVLVGSIVVKDPDSAEASSDGSEVIVSTFSQHQLVNPIVGSGLDLIQPRPVGRLPARTQAADAPHVEEIAFSGKRAYSEDNPAVRPSKNGFPFAATVESGNLKVVTERGTTRMVVVGESLFLDNRHIDALANRDFANCAINWLLERPQLFEGLGPKPLKDYRFVMSKQQSQNAIWILLAVQPGAVLLLGALVWFRRRR
jgi:ABC-type uncharacterized transport system involved in gliding motility auxiliary subunit